MRHNRRDDGQLSCRKREMKTMNANTALDGHTTVIKMAERGGVPLMRRIRPGGLVIQHPSMDTSSNVLRMTSILHSCANCQHMSVIPENQTVCWIWPFRQTPAWLHPWTRYSQ